eukprot:6179018-Pleurochrysis_carterae.AAC.1
MLDVFASQRNQFAISIYLIASSLDLAVGDLALVVVHAEQPEERVAALSPPAPQCLGRVVNLRSPRRQQRMW